MADEELNTNSFKNNNQNLLSSRARIQVPWIKVTIGEFTFGVRTSSVGIGAFPNYITGLQVEKINGQVNKYDLTIAYPVTADDDPNFFDKIFSSVSNTRKIVFSYGDAAMPGHVYKEEEALITAVEQTFGFGGSGKLNAVIGYKVKAISTVALSQGGSYTFINSEEKKPSDEIKRVLLNPQYGLTQLFPGIDSTNIDSLIAGSDKSVQLETKTNISALDYIKYLASCMQPEGAPTSALTPTIYIMTIHDETTQDEKNSDALGNKTIKGPYMTITDTTVKKDFSEAYEIDIGINTSTLVTNFSILNNETYAMYFDYQNSISNSYATTRIDNSGNYVDIFSNNVTSKNDSHTTKPDDTTWWTKLTQYPISAELTIQGLLRPAKLMQYIRLNVIFPGGHLHNSSGLYIITKQIDTIDAQGYRTKLSLTRIAS